jgi:hypothetical protein
MTQVGSEGSLTGACLCGGVRFEITAPLGPAGYCHCGRCQRRTGAAASATARIDSASLRILSGENLIRGYRPEDGFEKIFCASCGSSLFTRNPADPSQMGVRLGVVDGDPGVRPSWHQFVAYAASWEPIPDDGLPRYDEGRPASSKASPETGGDQ